MTQEEKDLLLKDLCARQPYGVKCNCYDGRLTATLTGVKSDTELYFHEFDWKEDDGIIEIEFCKPYLFPLSSLTEKQCDELYKIAKVEYDDFCNLKTLLARSANLVNWCMQNHIDINGLIPMGMALDATGLNIY